MRPVAVTGSSSDDIANRAAECRSGDPGDAAQEDCYECEARRLVTVRTPFGIFVLVRSGPVADLPSEDDHEKAPEDVPKQP